MSAVADVRDDTQHYVEGSAKWRSGRSRGDRYFFFLRDLRKNSSKAMISRNAISAGTRYEVKGVPWVVAAGPNATFELSLGVSVKSESVFPVETTITSTI